MLGWPIALTNLALAEVDVGYPCTTIHCTSQQQINTTQKSTLNAK